jgi:glutaredoxin 2
MLPIFAVWELWKERNSRKFENEISQPAAIIQQISDWLKDCSQLLDIRSSGTFTDYILLGALHIHQARKLAIDFKIHVDGA